MKVYESEWFLFIDAYDTYAKNQSSSMHLISIRALRTNTALYPDVKKPVEDWYATVRKSEWQNLEDVRRIYRDAESVGNFTVFNVKGNSYRLIVGIDYTNQTVYYKYLLTHSEYDKGKWKNDPYF